MTNGALARAQMFPAKYTLDLSACGEEVAAMVGGKARGLHFLIAQGLPVPSGFAVSTDAYQNCIASMGIEAQIVDFAATAKTPTECEAASARIRALFTDAVMAVDIATDIAAAYQALDKGRDCPVAVRSSATAEDTAEASFAGQQDTYLHIRGVDDLLQHVIKCWASLYTAQAIGYRARFNVPHEGLAMAVVVQRMVEAEAAGVMMSLDPTNGRRNCIYIESALGLGEGVVRGDVGSDRYWVDKTSLVLTKQEINIKQGAHRFDRERNEVRIVDVPVDQQQKSALRPKEIRTLAAMAKQAEVAFGAPVDMEWGVGPGAQGPRTVQLLQARPETVWSAQPENDSADEIGSLDDWDNLHNPSAPELYWSTSNVGEAMPGVSTPLSWSVWAPAAEFSLRGGAYMMGALTHKESKIPPRIEDRWMRVFFGRPAISIEYLATVGDRMPGTSGQEIVRDILGKVPESMKFSPTMRHYPTIAWRLPWNFLVAPIQARRHATESSDWWRACVAKAPGMDMATAIATMNEATEKLNYSTALQTAVQLGIVTPLYNAIGALVKKTGVGDTAALGGFGGVEMEVIGDIWRTSRGEIGIDDLLKRHGFHGPFEGELSSTVWREDDSPLRSLLAEYAARDDSADPRLHGEQRRKAAVDVARQLLAVIPLLQRPFVWMLLKLAATHIPLRGISKRSFVQQLDVCRVCAKRIGDILVAEGKLDMPGDVFYLTIEELRAGLPVNAKELIIKRRKRRAAYAEVTPPADWQGMPEAIRLNHESAGDRSAAVHGTGVSPGIVEGRARVLLTPDFAQVEPGEILVTPTTDPSWSSVMFISAGLVVDIGGAVSHAAIVARELGIPCVVNTQNGSRTLRTGDLLRVDGAKGSVEIIERVEGE